MSSIITKILRSSSASSPTNQYAKLVTNLAPARQALVQHKMYGAIRTRAHLQTFMASHVFAVWDFMSLVKTLQQRIAPSHAPWTPPKQAELAGAINDIVAAEESDRIPSYLLELAPHLSSRASHLELYLESMRDVGEPGTAFHRFLGQLETRRMGARQGGSVDLLDAKIALGKTPSLPSGVDAFVRVTLRQCAPDVPTHQVAAAFLFGREGPIPLMFTELLARLNVVTSPTGSTSSSYPFLRFYLERHIELDGNEHAHLGRDMLCQLCQDRPADWAQAEQAARESIRARIALWDAISQRLD